MFKNLITMFQTWNTKWGDKKVFEIAEDSPISFEKYLDIRKKYKEQSDTLYKAYNEEAAIKEELLSSNQTIVSLNTEINKLNTEIAMLQSFAGQLKNIDILKGKWECTRGEKKFIVEIVGNNFYINNEFDKRDMIESNIITHFIYDAKQKNILVVRRDNNLDIFYVNDLNYKNERLLTGSENNIDIRYSKIE